MAAVPRQAGGKKPLGRTTAQNPVVVPEVRRRPLSMCVSHLPSWPTSIATLTG